MGFFSKVKDLVGIEDVDDDEEESEEEIKEKDSKEIKHETSFTKPAAISTPSASVKLERPEPIVRPDFSKTIGGRQTADIKMIVVEPQGFDECPRLVDNLKAKKPVVINLENLDTDVARKIFDFLSGATYALNGNVQKVANNIFVFAPANVDISYNSTQKTQLAEKPVKSPW